MGHLPRERTPAPVLRRVPTPPPQDMDWVLPTGIDRVPRHWGAFVALLLLGVAGVAIATGWYHRIPGLFRTAREMVRARFGW
jgi:hypothetical protein